MAKARRGASVNLDSFLDIMTCMLGVLILIILLTGLDASQIKVLIPTPLEMRSDKRSIFIECRDDQLFLLPAAELRDMAESAMKDLMDKGTLLQELTTVSVATDNHKLDIRPYAMLNQLVIFPADGGEGYRLHDIRKEKATDWFGAILTGLDREKEMLTFMVRDDSFTVFKRARALAWEQKIEVSYELIDASGPIRLHGHGVMKPVAQ